MAWRRAVLLGVLGAAVGFLALQLSTPDVGRVYGLRVPVEIINSRRLNLLVLNLTQGLRFGLATFLVSSSGRIAWAGRRLRPSAFAAVLGATWILVGVWLQQILLNVLTVRQTLFPWVLTFDALFVVSAALVVWFIAVTLTATPVPPHRPGPDDRP